MNLQSLTQTDITWIARRVPKPVASVLRLNPRRVCIAGGFIRSLIANEEVNDIDIFAADKDLAKLVATQLALEAPDRRDGQSVHSLIYETGNALTVLGYPIKPQVVHRWTFPEVKDVIPSFDFTIARAAFYWDGLSWRGLCDPSFYSDLAAKRLVYCQPERNEDAGGSMLRVLKFYQRGYRIPLDSLALVIGRLMSGVKPEIRRGDENDIAGAVTGLLVEVDPQVDPNHDAHL